MLSFPFHVSRIHSNLNSSMPLSTNIRNSLLLISEKIIILGMSFLTSVLMARIAGPEFFGEFAYITSFTTMFIPFCAMGLNGITTKYFIKYPKLNHHFFLTALLIRGVGALSCIVLGSFIAYLTGYNSQQTLYIIILLTLQSFSLFYLVEHYFLAKEKVLFTLKIRLVISLVVGITKIFIITSGADLLLLVIVHGLEFTLIGLGYLTLYIKKYNGNKKKQKKKKLKKSISIFFHKGKWLLFSSVSAVLYLKIDQIMLANIHGTEEVAYYAAAAKLSEFWYIFPILIANAFNPQLVKIKKKSIKKYNELLLKMLSVMVASSLTISVLTYLLASPIIELIYGNAYHSSASILSIHIFATLFIFQRAILSKWLIIENRYKFSLISHGAGAIANILLNICLIPTYGGIGAAWATLFSYMVASFLSLTFTRGTREFMMLMLVAMVKWPKYLFRLHEK